MAQKVFVALDVRNLLAVCKYLLGNRFRINYKKLLQAIVSDCEPDAKIEAVAYFTSARKYTAGGADFASILSQFGYQIEKQILLQRTRPGLYILSETDWCAGIATDIVSGFYERNYDVFIIITGDNDFRRLCKFLLNKKKRVGLYTFNNASYFRDVSFVRQLDEKYTFTFSRRRDVSDDNQNTSFEEEEYRE